MTGVLRPVGPQPERVYWVRRAVVLGVVLLVAVLVAVALGALSGPGASADDAPGGSTAGPRAAEDDAADTDDSADDSAGDEGEESSGVVGRVTCDPGALSVTLTAESRMFEAPAAPTFAFAVTNTGEVPCTVDAGSGSQVVTIVSGADRIWSNADCAGETEERLLLLLPGAADTVSVAWDRTRSDEACTAGLPAPGAGTYQAVGTMLGAQSAPYVFDLG